MKKEDDKQKAHSCKSDAGQHCDCNGEHGQAGGCGCGESCNCKEEDLSASYLQLAQRLQAEFENYRKRTESELKKAREEGEINIIEAFLPCLDTFKTAKKSITDAKILEGVEMIEQNILSSLEKVGVKRIETVGKKYEPNLHNAIAITQIKGQEEDVIVEEYQAGYIFNDKVIRYSKVIVNKKEGD